MMLRDGRGVSIALGIELGRGGEGAVYDLPDHSHAVAKIYHNAPDRRHAQKLDVMVGLASPGILKLAAWPLSTLRDEHGAVVGFTMPRFSGLRPVFQVYGPKLRLRHYPKADWRFLVRTAANTSRGFDAVHEAGHVIGDVNHGNLFVAMDATVRLIDTDSFQITRAGRTWACEVGVGTHQPPEMQGLASYRDIVRTRNHDAFGLAVIIYQLLCMGRHPFMGRYTGTGEPPDIPTAIASSRYAHSKDQSRTQMSPGIGSLPISSLPEEIQAMFEAAFAPRASAGGRPTAAIWGDALHRLGENLLKCPTEPGHWFPRAASACPWCRLEAVTGASLFPIVFVAGTDGSGIALLWQEVLSTKEPAKLCPLKEPGDAKVPPSPTIKVERRARTTRRLLASAGASLVAAAIMLWMPEQGRIMPLLAVLTATAWFWNRPKSVAAIDAAERLREVRDEWREMEVERRTYAGPETFRHVRQELDRVKYSYDALMEEQKKRLAELTANRRLSQLEQHLESFDLAGMRISGIGSGKVATLISYGICSAADISAERLASIPGFGPKTISNMVAAREICGRTFRFDPKRAIAPAEMAALDRDIARRRRAFETELASGLCRLKAVADNAAELNAQLEERAANLSREYVQALADVRAAGQA